MAKQYGNSNEIYKAALSRAGLGEVGVTPIKKKKPVENEFEALLQEKTLPGIAQGKYGIVDGQKLSNEKKDTKGIIQNWRGYVSDEEIENYDFLKSVDKDLAEDYYRDLKDKASQKAGASIADAFSEKQGVGRTLSAGALSVAAGLQDVGKGVAQTVSRLGGDNDTVATGQYQYALPEAQQDMTGFGKVATSVGRAGAALAPSIGASIAVTAATGGAAAPGVIAGLATMAPQIWGNAYKTSRDSGHTDEEALTYAAANTVLELGLQYGLGGIGKLGGAAVKGITSAAAKSAANATAKSGMRSLLASKGGKYFAGMVAEGGEEYLQAVIDPITQNVIYGEENKVNPFSEEALYAGLVGALTAGVLNAPGSAVSNAEKRQMQQVNDAVQKGYKEGATVDQMDSVVQAGIGNQTPTLAAVESLPQMGVDTQQPTAGLDLQTVEDDSQISLFDGTEEENALAGFDNAQTEDDMLSALEAYAGEENRQDGTERGVLFNLPQTPSEQVVGNENAVSEQRISQWAAQTGRNISFVDDAEMQQRFPDVAAGSRVGGYYDPQTRQLYVNRQSDQGMRFLFGHELTHSLGANELSELQSFVFRNPDSDLVQSWLQKRGYSDLNDAQADYIMRYAAPLTNGSYTLNDLDMEIVADFCADTLFGTDADIQRICREQPSLARRVLDFIEEMLAAFGIRERSELSQLRDMYRRGLYGEGNAAQKDAAADGGTRYSLYEFKDGRRFVDVNVDQQLFDGLNDKEKTKLAISIIKKRFAGKPVGIDNPIFVNGRSASEYGHPVKNITPDIRNAKMRASTELDNLVDAGANYRTKPDGEDGHIHPNAVNDFEYLDVIFKVGGEYYKGVVNIENVAKGRLLKDITQIKNITQDISSSYGKNPKSTFLRDSSMGMISREEENVKYSLSDSEGHADTFYPKTEPGAPQPASGLKTRKTAETIGQYAPELDAIVVQFNEAAKKYKPKSMSETTAEAMQRVQQRGAWETLDSLSKKKVGKWTAEDFEDATYVAAVLEENPSLTERTGAEATASFMTRYYENATKFGQVVNFMKLLRQNLPETFVSFGELAAKGANVELDEQTKRDLEILGKMAKAGAVDWSLADGASKSLQKWLRNAETQLNTVEALQGMEKQLFQSKASQVVVDKLPRSNRAQFRALQRISLLSNVVTHERNIMGNVVNIGGHAASSFAMKAADKWLSGITGQRTYGQSNLRNLATGAKGIKTGTQIALAGAKLGGLDLTGGSKYGDEAQLDTFGQRGRVFDTDNPTTVLEKMGTKTQAGTAVLNAANKVDNVITIGLSLGDSGAWRGAFDYALASLCEAQGIPVSEATPELIDAATEEANVLTFRDNNAVTKALEKVRESIGPLGDVIAPFVRTPVNVIKTSMEYSPIGVVEALYKTFVGENSLRNLAKNDAATIGLQREIARLLGRGTVGTALLLMGVLMGQAGLITGEESDNEKEAAFQKAQGFRANSLKIGDTYIDMSSLQSLTTPLVAGAAAGAAMGEDDAFFDFLTAFLSSSAEVGNTALEMPVLQGVEELLGGQWEDTSVLLGLLGLGMDAVSQVVPFGSALRQVAKAIEPESKMTTEINRTGLDRAAAEFGNELQSIVPGARSALPTRYDVLGNPMQNSAAQSGFGNVLNSMLNPFITSRATENDVTDEVDRLFEETGNRDVLPRVVGNDITYGGAEYDFSTEEKMQYQRRQGEIAADMIAALLEQDIYTAATEAEKAKMVERIYDYAADSAKKEFLEARGVDYQTDSWYGKVRQLEEAGIPADEAFSIREMLNAFEVDTMTAKEENEMKRLYINSLDLTDEQKSMLDEMFISDTTIIPTEVNVDYSTDGSFYLTQMSEAAQKKYELVAPSGMDELTYFMFYPLASSGKKDECLLNLQLAGMTEEQAEWFWKTIRSN